MNTPLEKEQVSETPENPRDTDTESLLSAEFDRMASEEETGETEVTEETSTEEVAEVVAESEETETVVVEEEQEQQQEEQQSAEESGYSEPPPERWPEKMREYYNQLEPEGRKMMMEDVYKPMQRSYTESTQELAGMRKAVEPMLASLNQYKNDFERMGVNPEEAFRTQMAWAAHFARVGPEKGLSDMRDAYGLNSNAPGEQTAEQYLTPTERMMRTEIDGLKKQVAETSGKQNSWQEQQTQNAQDAHIEGVRNDLQSFINEQKDGKPAHPHVEKVAPAIAGIIRGGLIKNTDSYGKPVPIRDQMAQAYDMACRLDPGIRTATTTTRQVETVKNAQAADVVANNPAGQANVPNLSMSEQLEENYDALDRRVG